MNLENKERVLLLGLVKDQIRKGQNESDPSCGLNGKKPRKQYGISKMTTLYDLESKLKNS